jgi:hypothetical protein
VLPSERVLPPLSLGCAAGSAVPALRVQTLVNTICASYRRPEDPAAAADAAAPCAVDGDIEDRL